MAPPSPPQNVEAAATPDGIQVTWEAPLFTGGSDAVTYRVYRDSALLADGLASTSFLDASFGSASTHTYTVTAVNEVGESGGAGGVCLSNDVPPQIAPLNCAMMAVDLVLWVVETVEGQLPA